MTDLFEYTSDSVTKAFKKIRKSHDEGVSGRDTSLKLTQLANSAILSTAKSLKLKGIVLCAIGGFGRCQLSPYSDIDLLTIYIEVSKKGKESVSKLVRTLWDLGFTVSHNFVNIKELKEKALSDLHFFSSLLDLRIIQSETNILNTLNNILLSEIFPPRFKTFPFLKLKEIHFRHNKFGLSSRMLEPNIKESAGGLRDVHSLIWLYLTSDMLHPIDDVSLYPRHDEILKSLSARHGWHSALTKRLLDATDLMLRVRHEIHYLKKSNTNYLTFDIRDEVAKNLAVSNEDIQSFLRNYYRSSRNISRALRLSEEYLNDSSSSILSQNEKHKEVFTNIFSDGNRLYLTNYDSILLDNNMEKIMKLFRYSKISDLRLSSGLLFKIEHQIIGQKYSSKDKQKSADIFFSLFSDVSNLASILRQLFESGIIQILIPDLDDIYCYAPKSKYHYYTTDEHTMRALEVLEDLADLEGIGELNELMRNIGNKNELLLAVLFHDMAKPWEKIDSQHVVEGAKKTETILLKMNFKGDVKLVKTLILNHLVMEHVSFRRDLMLPETIEKFVDLISNKTLLDRLYLLTYADLYAVNPNVWSEWKKSLLSQLYRKAVDYYNGYQPTDAQKVDELLIEELEKVFKVDKIRKLLKMLPTSYQRDFDSRQIINHIKMAGKVKKDSLCLQSKNYYNFSEITVVTDDRPFLLSDICGVFAVNDVSVFEAKIYTRTDGIIIDNFRVISSEDGGPLESELIVKLEDEMTKVLKKQISTDDLFKNHIKRWKWKTTKKEKVPIFVEFEETKKYSIIDITGSDKPGLLYSITKALSKMGLIIYSAKISTKVDGLIDSFYLLDEKGNKIGVNVSEQQFKEAIINEVEKDNL